MAAEVGVASSRNVRHIADTWFSTRKHLVYRLHRLDDATATAAAGGGDGGGGAGGGGDGGGGGAGGDGVERSTLIPTQTKCRDVDWYLSNVAASVMFTPNSMNPMHFGILQVRRLSGLAKNLLRSVARSDGAVHHPTLP